MMGGECNTHWRDGVCTQILFGQSEEKIPVEDLFGDVKIILDVWEDADWIHLVKYSERFLWTRNEPSRSARCREFFVLQTISFSRTPHGFGTLCFLSHRRCASLSFNITIFRSPSTIVPAHLRRRHLLGLSTLHLRYSDFSAAGKPRRRTPETSSEVNRETPCYHQNSLIVDVDDGEGLSFLSFTRMRSGFVSRDCSEVGKAALNGHKFCLRGTDLCQFWVILHACMFPVFWVDIEFVVPSLK